MAVKLPMGATMRDFALFVVNAIAMDHFFEPLFSPYFAAPFAAGLALSLTLPLLGMYLKLHGENLAALAYAQVAAAGALLSVFIALPVWLCGLVGATLAALSQPKLIALMNTKPTGNDSTQHGFTLHALFFVGGWCAVVLLVNSHPAAESLGRSLFDGQLYFVDKTTAIISVAAAVFTIYLVKLLGAGNLLARLYPALNTRQQGRIKLIFSALSAMILTFTTLNMGIMAAFALVLIPPWLAYRHAQSWRSALLAASLGGGLMYCVAFAVATWVDQPFGAIFALVMLIVATVSLILTAILA